MKACSCPWEIMEPCSGQQTTKDLLHLKAGFFQVILTVRFCLQESVRDDCKENGYSQGTQPFPKQVCFQVRIPKPNLENYGKSANEDNQQDLEGPQIETVPDDDGDSQTHAMIPFVKYLSLEDSVEEPNRLHAHARFMGYNVQPIGDGIHLEEGSKAEDDNAVARSRQFMCHVQMSFAW